MTKQDSAFSFSIAENGVAHLIMDVPGETMNTLKSAFAEEIAGVLEKIKKDSSIKAVVLSSGKKNSFVAGADISMLAACHSVEEATKLSRQGQEIFDQLENLAVPVVAAIHGPCLGGGLELAMACHYRVASDSSKTALGLPEVQLGLLPGGGGTQRLPRIVGIQKALDMMLTGKQLRPKQALKAGLVSDVVPETVLISVAEKLALSSTVKKARVKLSAKDKLLEGNPIGQNLIFSQATKSVLAKTKGNYPAPLKIIDCVKTGIQQNLVKGYKAEADHFGELVMTPESEQLRNIFFATTEMKKEQGIEGVEAKAVDKVGVLGGGLMGGGIAYVTATKANKPVRIKDINHNGISHALKYGYDLLNKKVKRRFLRKTEMQAQLAMITGTTDYSGFHDANIVVEAVFEDLKLKQQMVLDVEKHCGKETIFASNTSSLPIGQIASESERPEQVIGLHYFSPVDKMPLAEIIAHETTSDETISTTVDFAKKQGKTPIVVKDTAGFYVNRILAPYMNEAANLVLAGEPIDKVDKALVNYGFPVGPMQLLDEVGIDVGSKISPILEKELGTRFKAPPAFDRLLDDGRKGKKSNKGFYQYGKSTNKGKKQVDESVYTVLGITPGGSLSEKDIAERCTFLMVNEAMRCLDEGVVRNARDGDIGAIFGIGFPPFLGGPFRLVDKLGADYVVSKLSQWAMDSGEQFEPCESLVSLRDKGTTIY